LFVKKTIIDRGFRVNPAYCDKFQAYRVCFQKREANANFSGKVEWKEAMKKG